MNQTLKRILINHKEQDFSDKITKLQNKLFKKARFQKYLGKNSLQVLRIVQAVGNKKTGTSALLHYTKRYDTVNLSHDELKIPKIKLKRAHNDLKKNNPRLLYSIRKAIKNVKKYQAEIFFENKLSHHGIKYTPLESIGICVPGASAPLPSSVIMTAVPAQVAGVEKIVIVSPPRYRSSPRYKGTIHPVTLAVCYELGLTEVYRVGGAQAIAALAMGTPPLPKVHKIVGPGNEWVQTAKKMVFGYVDIDSIAGPSEVLILATQQANPTWVAADMLSQTEHAPGSAILFTDSASFAQHVLEELESQVYKLDRASDTMKFLKQYSLICVFKNMNDAINKANDFAPEHLQIQCGRKSRQIAKQIKNAGAIFIGAYTPVAVGDYWAGPSHTLPTGSTAKFFSAVTSNDFIKSSSIIEYTQQQLADAADDIVRLALTEGLDAHAKSIQKRME